MFVRVTVDPTEKIPTAAAETWKSRRQMDRFYLLHERLRSHSLVFRLQNLGDAVSYLTGVSL